MKGHTPDMPKPGKMLNAGQRNFLSERIDRHVRMLERQERSDAPVEPPQIVAARKLIDEWEERCEMESKDRDKKLLAHVKKLRESLLFDSAESALLQVNDFEKMNWDDFQPNAKGKRDGAPGWDR